MPHPGLVSRASWGSFARFVTVGGSTTALSAGGLLVLREWMPLAVANIAAMVVGTIIANELHARWTFRSPERGLRMHTEAGFTTLITYVLSSGALLVLERTQPDASGLVVAGVQVGATAVAGALRYLLLLVWVFAVHRHYPDAHAVRLRPSAAGATRIDLTTVGAAGRPGRSSAPSRRERVSSAMCLSLIHI